MGRAFFPDYAVVDVTTVSTVDNTTKATDYIAMAGWEYIDFIINTTDASADTTVDAKLQSADDASGTNVADISGLAITQFTAAATAKAAVLRVRSDQLNTADTHVRCLVTCGDGTGGSATSIVALGFGHHYAPASDYDTAEVVQIKSI